MNQDIQLTCSYHFQKEVSGVCVQDKCDKLRPACFNCLTEFHETHAKNVKDLDQYKGWREEALSIHSLIISVLNKMKDLTVTLQECLRVLNLDAKISLNSLTISQIQEQTSKLIKLKALEPQFLQDLKQLDSDLLNVKEKTKQYNFKPSRYQDIPQQIKGTLTPNIISKFSETYKHNSVTLSEKGSFAEGNGYCFCESPIKNEFTRIVFKIIACGSNVWIGVSARKSDNSTNLQKIGHKSYLLHNQGFSFSHHQQSVNGNKQKFKFQDNDRIILDIDKNKITWINNQQQYCMEISIHEDLYPFVELNYGKIQILNE